MLRPSNDLDGRRPPPHLASAYRISPSWSSPDDDEPERGLDWKTPFLTDGWRGAPSSGSTTTSPTPISNGSSPLSRAGIAAQS
jgi:hypothetical protein